MRQPAKKRAAARKKSKSPKQVAFGYPPRSLLMHLQKELPGFAGLPENHQTGYVSLLWSNIGSKRYSHALHDGYFTVYYQLLDSVFGEGRFTEMNKRLGLFDVIGNWSVKYSLTKAYKPNDKAYRILETYFTSVPEREQLITDEGGNMTNKARAIRSRDINHNNAKQKHWSKLNLAVPIDVKALSEGIESLKLARDSLHYGRVWEPSTAIERYIAERAKAVDKSELEDWVYRRIIQAHGMQRLAHVSFLDGDQAPQQYVESDSGRLYGIGLHLQNVAKEVKLLALNGSYEYDLENCHYSLLAQLAEQHKVETPALEHYLSNKKAVRAEIALSAGITKDQAKTCLIALIYGAKLSQRAVDAIPAEIGKEAAQRLYGNDLFKGIANDIREARKAVIGHLRAAEHNARGKRNGFISNALGKTIKRNAPPNEIMAHVLQGIEAKMLGIAITQNLDEILLLQHDGFTSSKRIDTKKLESEIYRQTGFKMAISESQIQL